MTRAEIERELQLLRGRVADLEAQLAVHPVDYPPHAFYWPYHVLAGFSLGMFGAATSLLFNVIGSAATGRHPLELIRVYLTFPLGTAALSDGPSSGGLMLAIGCCLYLATGMVLGVPFHLVLRQTPGGVGGKFAVATVLATAVWLVNFYGLLSWLQPALYGGRWIVDLIPWWVAWATHLVFGWTMVLVEPLGHYEPYHPPSPAEVA